MHARSTLATRGLNRLAITSNRAAATSSPTTAGTTAIAATSARLCHIDAQNSESCMSCR